MGHRYLRGPLANNSTSSLDGYVANSRDFCLITYYYLRRILGYTLVEEVQQAGSTWVWDTAHEHTATDGVLTAVDYTFTSAAGLFAPGDVGKFLVIVDPTNEENCGVYEVATYVSATQVTLNWYTTGGNYPTAQTGLEWYLIDGETAGTPKPDDFFVLEVPHATSPYTMKCRRLNSSQSTLGLGIEVAPKAAAWDTGTSDWKTSVPERIFEIKLSRGGIFTNNGRTFAAGHTDGSFWMVWDHHNAGTGSKSGGGVCVLGAIESSPTPDPSELVFAFGQDYNANESTSWNRDSDTYTEATNNNFRLANGHVWDSARGKSQRCSWGSWRKVGSGDMLRDNIAVNARSGQRDGLPIWVLRDPYQNVGRGFSPWGEMPTASIVLSSAYILGEHASFNSDNNLHIRDAVTVTWPGLPFA